MKNKLALGVMAVSIFGLGLETGIVLTKCVLIENKKGVN